MTQERLSYDVKEEESLSYVIREDLRGSLISSFMASSHANSTTTVHVKAGSTGSFEFEICTKNHRCTKTSPIFTYGERNWCLKCCVFSSKDIELSLVLISGARPVKATIDSSLLGKDGHLSTVVFKREAYTFTLKNDCHRVLFVKSNNLKDYLTKDCFTAHCNIFIADKKNNMCATLQNSFVPYSTSYVLQPHGLVDHFCNLLQNQDISDVKFEVEGEIFHAHRVVLAARSPVFKAELFGPMVEANKECIKIEDMNSEVFRVLLQYIYTDSVDVVDLKVTHDLLEAADRYTLVALRAMCEEKLCKNVNLDTVLNSLALADKHNCRKLLNTCLNFAAVPENLLKLAESPEYLDFAVSCPALFCELTKRANACFVYKKQKMP